MKYCLSSLYDFYKSAVVKVVEVFAGGTFIFTANLSLLAQFCQHSRMLLKLKIVYNSEFAYNYKLLKTLLFLQNM